MQTASIAPGATTAAQSGQSAPDVATNAFGLSFESLLQIILTQLTYQDPLKPMENFEFVSQLAQFSQIQQGQVMSDRLQQLVAAQSASQATTLLGRQVDVATASGLLTGSVTAVSLQNGDTRFTVKTAAGQTVSNLSLSDIVQVRTGG